MKDFLERITPYNLFNYLLPGTVYALLVTQMTRYSFIQDDLFIGAFYYYFLGLVISRFGSLIIQPTLEKVGFISVKDYEDYLETKQNDPTISSLSEINNVYRTLISLFVLLLLTKLYEYLEGMFHIPPKLITAILPVVILACFLFAYRKQTKYIAKRIEHDH